jgi:hypothetical protein
MALNMMENYKKLLNKEKIDLYFVLFAMNFPTSESDFNISLLNTSNLHVAY